MSKDENALTVISGPSFKAQIAAALPSMVKPDYFVRVAMTVLRTKTDLQNCNLPSILGSIMTAAQVGLSLDPVLGQAYLVPFGKECQLIPGYRGLGMLAVRSGTVASYRAVVVHENDHFEHEEGLERVLIHKPAHKDKGAVLGAYAVVTYKHGEKDFEFMPLEDLEKIRKRSRASNSGPWVTDTEEMYKKTVLRRLFKRVPVSVEDQNMTLALALDNRSFMGKSQAQVMDPCSAPDDIPEAEELAAPTAAQKIRAAKKEKAEEPGPEPEPPAINPKEGWFYCDAAKREISPDAVDSDLCAKCPGPGPDCKYFK